MRRQFCPLAVGAVVGAVVAAAAAMPAAVVEAAEIDGVTLPQQLEVGGERLDLAGCGTRESLFTNIYVVGLYLPDSGLSQQETLSAGTAKAARLQIVYDGSLPDGIPDSWEEPVREMTQKDIERAITAMYENFQSGDQVTIGYTPQMGTVVSVNGSQTRTHDGHELIDPVLRLWLGDRAVSTNLRQLLLSGVCAEDDGWF